MELWNLSGAIDLVHTPETNAIRYALYEVAISFATDNSICVIYTIDKRMYDAL